ncbi:hypothetical protein ABZV93_06010 [Actinopolymorpha sp. NPDC004070]|uniref:hypothetical protein n=1 Tax=Actinopolymorpha sp. NPDC004070 TaxID=3154548 RepID=UPI0033BD2F2A
MTDDDFHLPPPRTMPRERRDTLRAALVAEVSGTSRPWWRRTWKGAAVGGSAFAMVLAGGAATAYVAFKPPSNTSSVVCYSAPKVDAARVDVTRVAVARKMPAGSAASAGGTVAIHDPVAACGQAWRNGLVSAGDRGSTAASPGRSTRVPTLVACTLDKGVAGVFPGPPSTCERLGLPRATR